MNLKRNLFRLWLVFSVIWVGAGLFLALSYRLSGYDAAAAPGSVNYMGVIGFLFGVPAALFLLGRAAIRTFCDRQAR